MGTDYKRGACRRQAKSLARTTERLKQKLEAHTGMVGVSKEEMMALRSYPQGTDQDRELIDGVFMRAIGSRLGGLLLPKVGLVCKLRAKCVVVPDPAPKAEPLSEPLRS